MAKATKTARKATSAKSTALALQDGERDKPTTMPLAPLSGMPSGYKVRRVLTLPTLVLKRAGHMVAVRFDSPPRIRKVAGKKGSDGKPQDPAVIADVTVVADCSLSGLDDASPVLIAAGEQRIMILGAVVASNLARDYYTGEDWPESPAKPTDEDYAEVAVMGKIFLIRHDGKRTQSQRYADFSIAEMESADV